VRDGANICRRIEENNSFDSEIISESINFLSSK
jgi:hypothetical protein